jgi:hypothetical protein
MFNNNSIVRNYEGIVGRVFYHDTYSHVVHVLVRVNTFTWKVEKWDAFDCYDAPVYLWPIETPFCIRYQKIHRTPDLKPLNMEIDELIR